MAGYLESVRQQYEKFPYPYRSPDQEDTHIKYTFLDSLDWINHYCFRGRQDFTGSFRALVAGGGTGDATIFLAEQLRQTDAQIFHLDISMASIEIAQRRAKVRQLDNIQFVHGSILDIENAGFDKFDYINCSGVLHHLEEPTAGLKKLNSVLNDNGAIGIMVYGQYGRTGVYQMQQLMRLINSNETNPDHQLQNTRTVLDSLPDTNWYKMTEHSFFPDSTAINDTELFDIFLHSQDTAYTVPRLYQWLADCDLNLIDFVEGRMYYNPDFHIKDPALTETIRKLPLPKQQAIAELIAGHIKKHVFYASPNLNTVADPHDFDNVPCLFERTPAKEFHRKIADKPPGSTIKLNLFDRTSVSLVLGSFAKFFFRPIDSRRTIAQCIDMIHNDPQLSQNKPTKKEITEEFVKMFKLLNTTGFLALRHKSVKPFNTFKKLNMPTK